MNDRPRRRPGRAALLHKPRRTGALHLVFLAFLLASCSPRAAISTPAPISSPTAQPAASAAPALTATATLPPPTPAASATPTTPVVTIAAAKGNLFVRRGPDMAFNPVGVLTRGQHATASGRDVLSKWLRIPVPGHPDQDGWVSIQTTFSAVSGDVEQLPEISPSYWPLPAFLRNCTFHNMTAEPGGIQIPSLLSFPNNDVRLNPGIYRVYDAELDDYPEVLKVELREGSAVDIRYDGNGDHRKCPVP